MALIERQIVITSKDADGNTTIDFPVTKAEYVEGALNETELNEKLESTVDLTTTQTITGQKTFGVMPVFTDGFLMPGDGTGKFFNGTPDHVVGTLSGTQYSGNSATATKATQDGAGNVITDTYATKEIATTTTKGLMSAADKTKLDGITANAARKLPYATCSTGGKTVAKVATVTNGVPFSLTAGTVVAVKFTNGLSSSGGYYNFDFSTLNVNSTGAKTVKMIYHEGTGDTVPQHSNNTYLFMYDGTYWNALSALHQRYNTAEGN